VQVWRGNAFSEIHGAPLSFIAAIRRQLAIPLAPTNDAAERRARETRFGEVFIHEGMPWGSLVRSDNRVPAGLTPYVLALAKHHGVPCELHDIRVRPEDNIPWWSVRAAWRPYQDEVHKRIITYGTGVIDAPPRSGKTLMAARAIDTIALPTVYVAPSLQIVRQTYEVFCKMWSPDFVARLDGDAKPSEKDITKPIVVATASSAAKQPDAWWKTRLVLVIDEFHHAAAETYHRISELASEAYYRLMFTGTHFRTAGDDLAMAAVCSQVLRKIEIKELVSGGYLAPPRIVFAPVPGARLMPGTSWDEAYEDGIVKHEGRNARVAQIAHAIGNQNGIPTIVLVKRRAHADLLGQMIPESVVVKGGEGALTSAAVKRFADGEGYVLIGTSVIGEGVDLPRASALIYAAGGDASVQMMQSYFRPLTACEGKSVGLIYDFHDNHGTETLKRHAAGRRIFAETRIGTQVVSL
jgi:superfamily II DNA or RNA helicase